jgi:hypothetical protein
MPMPISNLDEYDKVVNVSWFTPDKAREELTLVFPATCPSLTDEFLDSPAFCHFLKCIRYVALILGTS